jgi:transcription termination factor Rho
MARSRGQAARAKDGEKRVSGNTAPKDGNVAPRKSKGDDRDRDRDQRPRERRAPRAPREQREPREPSDRQDEEEVNSDGPTLDLTLLKAKTAKELVDIARELNVEGASNLRKQELIFGILGAQAQQSGNVYGEGVLEFVPATWSRA